MDNKGMDDIVKPETLAEDAIRAIIDRGPDEAKKMLAFLQREAKRLDAASARKFNLDKRLRRLKARILAESKPGFRPKTNEETRMQKEGLLDHIQKIKNGERRFENAHERLARMVRENWTTYEKGEYAEFMKSLWASCCDEKKDFTWLVVTGPENSVCEPLEYLCDQYAAFSSKPENRRFTFRFVNLGFSDYFRGMKYMQSDTFEDPMILAMNFFPDRKDNEDFLRSYFHFTDEEISALYKKNSLLSKRSEYIWEIVRRWTDGNVCRAEDMVKHIEVVPVPNHQLIASMTAQMFFRMMRILYDDFLERSSTFHLYHRQYSVLDIPLAYVSNGGIVILKDLFDNSVKNDDMNLALMLLIGERIEYDYELFWPLNSFMIATVDLGRFLMQRKRSSNHLANFRIIPENEEVLKKILENS